MKKDDKKDIMKEKMDSLRRAYFTVFNSEEGKKIIEDLKIKCYYNETTYSPEHGMSFYREGIRSTLLYILNRIEEGKNLIEE